MAHETGRSNSVLPFFDKLDAFRHRMHIKQGIKLPFWGLFIAFGVTVLVFLVLEPDQTIHNFYLLIFLAPIWLTALLSVNAWSRWMDSRRYRFNMRQTYVLLELRIPRDTRKSPLSMETVFSNIHLAPGQGTWYKRYWLGRTIPWYSLELVSIGGRVHFFIWARTTFRHIIETYLYAQYPGIEVVEATDYTRLIDPTKEPWEMWGCEYEKSKPGPYPIKTYVDFGMDKQPAPKPEEVIDPIANTIEFLGSLGPNEQLWIHIMIRMTKGHRPGGGPILSWRDEAKTLIEDIRAKTVKKVSYLDPLTGQRKQTDGFPNPTKGESETMAAIERNVSKPGFDVGIRAVYAAKEGHFRESIGAMVTQIFRQYRTENMNSLGPRPDIWSEEFNDFPWEDLSGRRYAHAMSELLEFARRRSYFYYPYKGRWMNMSTEELASIYHVPSSTVTAPNLPRIQSTTTEAPANLPT